MKTETQAEAFVRPFFDGSTDRLGSELYGALLVALDDVASPLTMAQEDQDWCAGKTVWTFCDGSKIVMQGSCVDCE